MFLTEHISLPDLLLEVLGNMRIAIICFPVCGIVTVEINFSFLIKAFSYMTKKSGQKFKFFFRQSLLICLLARSAFLEFRDGFRMVLISLGRCYLRTPTGMRHKNGTGL